MLKSKSCNRRDLLASLPVRFWQDISHFRLLWSKTMVTWSHTYSLKCSSAQMMAKHSFSEVQYGFSDLCRAWLAYATTTSLPSPFAWGQHQVRHHTHQHEWNEEGKNPGTSRQVQKSTCPHKWNICPDMCEQWLCVASVDMDKTSAISCQSKSLSDLFDFDWYCKICHFSHLVLVWQDALCGDVITQEGKFAPAELTLC